ncbi:MAG: dehydrogenase, selenocysteine-containing [bacterium]|nr:dehydrogenase, selenocysteine-containing [bacterium]
MPLLGDDDTRYLRESFAALPSDVSVTVVTREKSRLVLPGAGDGDDAADSSAEVKQIVDEVAATSPRIKVTHVDAVADADRATTLAGAHLPALVFHGTASKGTLRYFGLPAGYEMSTLIATLMDLGSGEPMVPAEVSDELAKLTEPVHIQVFVTPG